MTDGEQQSTIRGDSATMTMPVDCGCDCGGDGGCCAQKTTRLGRRGDCCGATGAGAMASATHCASDFGGP